MKLHWEDVNARARGLATHLLRREALDALAQLPDLAAIGAALRSHGYPLEEGEAAPEALELALRRMAAVRLRVLARWSGSRVEPLAVLFEDEDRRSLRALLRGAVQGAPAEARLAGLVPTPALPERALSQLAALPTPAAIAALLTAWGNSYGSALLAVASGGEPDLFTLEVTVNHTFAARASGAAGRAPRLAAHVRETIDLENAHTAILLATEGKDVVPKDVFLPGGSRIAIADFELAASAGDVASAGRKLAAAFAGTPLAPPLAQLSHDPAALEDAVLRARIRHLTLMSRQAPLGPAPLLAYVLRLRAETVDVQRIIWGRALQVSPATIMNDLVSV
ncbi:MAG TPA: V-type ATPase subunit [Gemmatimonadales bacterium]|nr:V-type ATPase subunit [Gemmatimonadales bacterium]